MQPKVRSFEEAFGRLFNIRVFSDNPRQIFGRPLFRPFLLGFHWRTSRAQEFYMDLSKGYPHHPWDWGLFTYI